MRNLLNLGSSTSQYTSLLNSPLCGNNRIESKRWRLALGHMPERCLCCVGEVSGRTKIWVGIASIKTAYYKYYIKTHKKFLQLKVFLRQYINMVRLIYDQKKFITSLHICILIGLFQILMKNELNVTWDTNFHNRYYDR